MATNTGRRLSSSILAALATLALLTTVAAAKPGNAGKADMSIAMTDSPDPARTGETITFSISLSNLGPSAASEVIATDGFPEEAELVSAETSKGSCTVDTQTQLKCTIGTMRSGETVQVVVELRTWVAGPLPNTASVTANESDPSRSNNSVTTSTEVYQYRAPSPTVTMNATPKEVNAGEIVVYGIAVQSNGSREPVFTLWVDMSLPDATEFVAVVPQNVTQPNACSYSRRRVLCKFYSSWSGATISLRALKEGPLTTTVSIGLLYSHYSSRYGGGGGGSGASVTTQVGPALAYGADTPLPITDSISPVTDGIEELKPNCFYEGLSTCPSDVWWFLFNALTELIP